MYAAAGLAVRCLVPAHCCGLYYMAESRTHSSSRRTDRGSGGSGGGAGCRRQEAIMDVQPKAVPEQR